MKKIAKLKKKLTVRMLSFIMAAGLLLLVVPFMAIAAGREDPNPGKSGDFSLFKGFSATTYEVLSADQQVYPEITAEDIEGATYQWQVYSYERERYVPLSGSKSVTITENLAARYCNDSRESYFRCVATDAEGNLLISDVLTVVLPKVESVESESQETEATRETVSTISLLDATTQPEGSTTQPEGSTTQPEGSTTQPEGSTTQPEDAATQPTDSIPDGEGDVKDGGQDNADGEPIEGQLLKPLDESDEGEKGDEGETTLDTPNEEQPPLLRGTLLEPLREVATTYKVVYYIQNANDSGYSMFKTDVFSANADDEVNYSSKTPGTTFDDYLVYDSSQSNASGQVMADGTSEFKLYFNRKTYTLTFYYPGGWNYSQMGSFTLKNGTTIQKNPAYTLSNIRYGEDIESRWPDNTNISTYPRNGFFSYYQVASITNVTNSNQTITQNPITLNEALIGTSGTNSLEFRFVWEIRPYSPQFTYNIYFMKDDGNYPATPNTTIDMSEEWNPLPTFNGYGKPEVEFTTYYGYYGYKRTTYQLKYPKLQQYTLSFESNGGTGYSSETLYENDSLSSYQRTPSKGIIEFDKWYYDSEFTDGYDVNWDTDKMPDHDVTIYAKWVDTYTVTVLNYENGTRIKQIENVLSDTAVPTAEEPTPTREGYTRDGTAWYYRDNGGTEQTFTFGSTPVTSDITLYAKWTVNHYNLRIHVNSDTVGTTTESLPYGTSLSDKEPAETPEKNGYTFGGWYTDEACSTGNEMDWANATMTVDGYDVYAKWTVKKYTVKFYNDERTSSDDNLIFTYSVEYNKTIPEYTGTEPLHYSSQPARFGKWVYLNDGTETDFTFGADGTHVTGNMKVYATWINIYTVTFLVDEGLSAGIPQNVLCSIADVDDNTVVVKPDDWTEPTKPDYTFDKWFYDNNGTPTEFKFSGETGATVITSNLTVYPTWRKNEVKLTISNEGANANIFTVQEQVQTQEQEQGFSMKVAVPANGTAVIAHLPFGTYTVAAGNWDFRNGYQIKDAANNPGSTFTANEVGQEFTFIATSSRNTVMWLGGSSTIALFTPVTGN